jgi:hypothetical protein
VPHGPLRAEALSLIGVCRPGRGDLPRGKFGRGGREIVGVVVSAAGQSSPGLLSSGSCARMGQEWLYGRATGRPLGPKDFSGGAAGAAGVLRSIGFEVRNVRDSGPDDWTRRS